MLRTIFESATGIGWLESNNNLIYLVILHLDVCSSSSTSDKCWVCSAGWYVMRYEGRQGTEGSGVVAGGF